MKAETGKWKNQVTLSLPQDCQTQATYGVLTYLPGRSFTGSVGLHRRAGSSPSSTEKNLGNLKLEHNLTSWFFSPGSSLQTQKYPLACTSPKFYPPGAVVVGSARTAARISARLSARRRQTKPGGLKQTDLKRLRTLRLAWPYQTGPPLVAAAPAPACRSCRATACFVTTR
jgi:hypothetical protein